MNIEAVIQKELGLTSYKKLKSLFSRRNVVALIRGYRTDGTVLEFIYKKYAAGNMMREYENLSRMRGKCVPAVLVKGENSLALEYVRGKTLLECLEEGEKTGESIKNQTDALLEFLSEFYNIFPGNIYGDINLRNFIMTEMGVFGVDLEEAELGNVSRDIGRMAAFILTYDPPWTDYKMETAQYLVRRAAAKFGIDETEITRERDLEFEAMRKRRKGGSYESANQDKL